MEVNYFLIYRNRYVTQLESLMSSFILLLFVVSDSLQPHELYPAMLLCPWDFSVKYTGVVCDFFSQGISPRIEPKSSVWQVDSLPLSHQGSPPSSSQQISTESLLGNVAGSGAVTVIKRQNVCPSGA